MLDNNQLGKKSAYISNYTPNLLYPLPRAKKRQELGINPHNPKFYGIDLWNHYEISWLNLQGKPKVAVGTISYSALSPNIIESKSMKLYFNSFNQTKFGSKQEVITTVTQDLSQAVGAPVTFNLYNLNLIPLIQAFNGTCLDDLNITCNSYLPKPSLLSCNNNLVTEEVYTHLLKSNCLVTNQPDWASLYINYSGPQIQHAGLLKYIISLRNHNEFHEQCVERIFYDIQTQCNPTFLTVYARYTRRGGLDINPYRTSKKDFTLPINLRLIRQ